jgi:hypothetical protein
MLLQAPRTNAETPDNLVFKIPIFVRGPVFAATALLTGGRIAPTP